MRELGGLVALAGCRSAPRAAGSEGGAPRWWRGNLHMHTYWSDGRAFPEQAVDLYKNRLGYDFLALSEHNVFADDAGHWKPVLEKEGKWPPDVTKPYFDAYRASASGKEAPTRTASDGRAEVRLRTYDEVRNMFEEPGRFLLMPGVEITQETDGINVHLNYVNLPAVVPAVKGHGARTVPIYSDDIGRTVRSVEGAEATYAMAPDDLYVRARIDPSLPSRSTAPTPSSR